MNLGYRRLNGSLLFANVDLLVDTKVRIAGRLEKENDVYYVRTTDDFRIQLDNFVLIDTSSPIPPEFFEFAGIVKKDPLILQVACVSKLGMNMDTELWDRAIVLSQSTEFFNLFAPE